MLTVGMVNTIKLRKIKNRLTYYCQNIFVGFIDRPLALHFYPQQGNCKAVKYT